MKKTLKIILLLALAIMTALTMIACDGGVDGKNSKKGISGSVSDGVYEIRKYYAEDGVDSLDLSAISLPDGITEIKIKSHAFEGNDTLKSIVVPSSVVEIGAGAFANMTKLESITLPFVGRYFNADYKQNSSSSTTEKKAVDAERTIAHLFGTEKYDGGSSVTVNYGSSTTTVYMPQTLTKVVVNAEKDYVIPMYAFNGVTKFTAVELKGSIVGIGESAFSTAGGIETFNIPASVLAIYKSAFASSYIKNFVFASTATGVKVEESAFNNCSILNYIGANAVTNYTIDLSVFSKSDMGRLAFENTASDIEYTVIGNSGVDMDKVFGETKIK